MFSLGSWKMDSAKEHRDYAVKVFIFVSKTFNSIMLF